MSIAAAGHFTYEIVLTKSAGEWSGRAAPPSSDSAHPGLVGVRPELELSNGVITLRRTESARRVAMAYAECQRPATWISFRIGAALETVAEDGEAWSVFRGGTGDIGMTLFRGDEFCSDSVPSWDSRWRLP